ncbi:COR domain-containing protein [Rhabdochromatium marinum]|uniref:leucine-rich repeat domain-containing protein n=1 Tax=Rhabdochromatium marinum TaxID=48729 RepID=UPI0019030786|nr:hypothetical protein [Rhabdochromatium marinum]
MSDLQPLAALVNLQQLNLSSTQVSDLQPLAALVNLQQLDLSSTQVSDLQPLAALVNLQQLDLSFTQVSDLQPLAALVNLQQLALWNTSLLNGLPENLVGLASLERLFLNPQPGLSEIPGEVLSQNDRDNCLPRLRAHLADLKTGATPLRDLKVIVLGNGRVGKTQLCRRLRGETFEKDADSTHGISVTSVDLSLGEEEEQPAILNLWDFGGQDLYHGTHALFMRTRAIFLLVWTPESEQGEHTHGGLIFRNQPLPYWLEYIRHLGGAKSPVILVQTRCDGGLGECPNLPVDADFLVSLLADGRLVKRVAYSAQDVSGRSCLIEAMQQAVSQLRAVQGRPLIGRGRLTVWDQLRTWRNADAEESDPSARRRLIPYDEFAALCAQQDVTSTETFVQVLHNAGMVFYQPNLFENQLILDQSWALDAIYAVFTREGAVHETLRRLGGRFTRPLLDRLLWRDHDLSAHDQGSLIDMMETSGICFVHRRNYDADETEYVAPDLLPDGRMGPPATVAGELAARWDLIPGDPLTTCLRFPFLSPSIGRAVLSKLGQLGRDTALYWRYGLCLYDAESRASAILEAIADADATTAPSSKPDYGGRLHLRVKGEGAERLLAVLVKRLETLNQDHGWAGKWEDSESQVNRPHRRARAESPSDDRDSTHLTLTDPPTTPPAIPEVYVSFAWKQDRAEPLVDDMIAGLGKQGIQVLRDSDQLHPGDSISNFMKRLSAGRCVLLVISEAYLRSPFCMTELQGIWVNARQREDLFRQRIVPLVQTDAGIGTPAGRIAHAAHWKQQFGEIDGLIREHGAEVVGGEDFRRFKLIGDFYRHVGDILSFTDDVLVPRDRPTLSRDDFAVVRDLIWRALQ